MPKKEIIRNNVFALIFTVLVIAIMFVYTNRTSSRILEYARFTVDTNAERISSEISNMIESSKNSILYTSYITNKTLQKTDNTLSKHEIISTLLSTSAFDNIEYIDSNGLNQTTFGEHFDASDRMYYKDGIKGNTGIWINYNPKYSDEYLLNFYTPLFVDNTIDGVITGTLPVKTKLDPTIQASFFGENMISLLCDETGQIIVSTLDFNTGDHFEDALRGIGINEEGISTFQQHISNINTDVFEFDGAKGISNACIRKIDSTNWTIIQIVPAMAFKNVRNRSLFDQFSAIGIIILLFLIFELINRFRVERLKKISIDYMQQTSNTIFDEATGLLNGKAYHQKIDELSKQKELVELTLISFDLDGLNKINNIYGQDSGDELIQDAADIIKDTFGDIGNCYRTGGDEFFVISEKNINDIDFKITSFEQKQLEWSKEHPYSMKIATGYARAFDFPDVSLKRLIHIADEYMYEQKRK